MFEINKNIYCPLIESELSKLMRQQPLINVAISRISKLYKSTSNGDESSRVELFELLLDMDDFFKKYQEKHKIHTNLIESDEFNIRPKNTITIAISDPISMNLLKLIDYVDMHYQYRQILFLKGKKTNKSDLITMISEVITIFKKTVYFSIEIVNENMLKASYTYPLMPSK